jgi:hypothetical protein
MYTENLQNCFTSFLRRSSYRVCIGELGSFRDYWDSPCQIIWAFAWIGSHGDLVGDEVGVEKEERKELRLLPRIYLTLTIKLVLWSTRQLQQLLHVSLKHCSTVVVGG